MGKFQRKTKNHFSLFNFLTFPLKRLLNCFPPLNISKFKLNENVNSLWSIKWERIFLQFSPCLAIKVNENGWNVSGMGTKLNMRNVRKIFEKIYFHSIPKNELRKSDTNFLFTQPFSISENARNLLNENKKQSRWISWTLPLSSHDEWYLFSIYTSSFMMMKMKSISSARKYSGYMLVGSRTESFQNNKRLKGWFGSVVWHYLNTIFSISHTTTRCEEIGWDRKLSYLRWNSFILSSLHKWWRFEFLIKTPNMSFIVP